MYFSTPNKEPSVEELVEKVLSIPPQKAEAPVKIPAVNRLPGACFDDCDQECVDKPFHANCPGYCDLK